MILDLVSYRFKHMITDIHVIIFARSLHNPKEKDIPQENGKGKNHFKIIDILKSQIYRFFLPLCKSVRLSMSDIETFKRRFVSKTQSSLCYFKTGRLVATRSNDQTYFYV